MNPLDRNAKIITDYSFNANMYWFLNQSDNCEKRKMEAKDGTKTPKYATKQVIHDDQFLAQFKTDMNST